MKGKISFSLVLIISLLAVNLVCLRVNHQLPKLPQYVGKGYNVFEGNPYHSPYDNGFKAMALDLPYTKGETTADEKYLIPDGLEHTTHDSCHSTYHKSAFTGMKSYQKNLNVKAEVHGGFEGGDFGASFSLSSDYSKMQNTTTESHHVVTEAEAECQEYKISLNAFADIVPSYLFERGVKKTLETKNWKLFIQVFGTHYATEIILGGRAFQHIEYSSEGIEKLSEEGISLSAAAEARFKGVEIGASTEVSKMSKEAQSSLNAQENSDILFVGGTSPPNDSIPDWKPTVPNRLVAIKYILEPLDSLFGSISGIDANAAKKGFREGIKKYCAERGCKVPKQDPPVPRQGHFQINPNKLVFGLVFGGQKVLTQKATNINQKISKITFGTNQQTNQIQTVQVQFFDGYKYTESQQIGFGSNLRYQTLELVDGDQIARISCCGVSAISMITCSGFQFHSRQNKSKFQECYGAYGTPSPPKYVPDGENIIGVQASMQAGKIVGSIRFITARIIYDDQ